MNNGEQVYASLTPQDIARRLREPKKTLVLFHVRPDADAIGSAFALRGCLEAMGSHTYCVCADEIPDRLRFLTNGHQSSAKTENLPADFWAERVVTVDVASPAQLGALYDAMGDKIDLMIDHHGRGTRYADGWVDGTFAATGEMIFELIRLWAEQGDLTGYPCDVPRMLYAAISSDTGGFRYSNTTPDTHVRAAELLKEGLDAAEINHRLFECKSYTMMMVEKTGVERIQLFADDRIGVVTFPYEVIRELGASPEHLETLVDIPRNLNGVMVAAALRQNEPNGAFRVSLRSSCDVDVANVCAAFGGGGHAKAAGCSITAPTAQEAVEMLVDKIIETL